jgi:4-hydroxybenzoate polyprenyltransferase
MLKIAQKIVSIIEDANLSFGLFISSFLAIILVRTLVEDWLTSFEGKSALMYTYEFYHKFLFFLIAYILFAITLSKLLKTEIKKTANILLFGYLILITPPLIDYYLSGGNGYWSFYDFGSLTELIRYFFTFFDNTPNMGITYGVRFEIAFSLVFIFIYSWIKLYVPKNDKLSLRSKIQNVFQNLKFPPKADQPLAGKIKKNNIIRIKKVFLKSIIITIISYAIFYILGTFPSWFTILFQGFSKGFFRITDVDTATLFISPGNILSTHVGDFVSALNLKLDIVYSLLVTILLIIIFWIFERKRLIAFILNARFPQVIIHSGLLLAGMGLGIYFTDTQFNFNLMNILAVILGLESVACAWMASVVINDIEDEEIDKITNPSRPLPKNIFSHQEYKTIGWVLFFSSLMFASIISFRMAILMAFYQAIAWIYSASPIRLKRFGFVSTFVSAIALLMVLFSGYVLISPEQSIKGLPVSIIILLAVCYTFSLPIKDLKDLEGDKRNGVYTIPVIFGDKWGRIVIGSGMFLSFLLSVILLHEPRLFWWAILAGGASYWIVNNQKIQSKRLPWWILGTVTIYGIIIVNIIFR